MPTYRVREPFLWRGRVYAQGAVIDGAEPVVARNLVLFEVIDAPAVEQATAAPGERRTLTRPMKGATRG